MPAPDRGVIAVRDAHVARWQGRLPVFPRGAFDEKSSITQLPARIAEIYPPIAPHRLAELAVALSLFSDAIVAFDDVMDNVNTMPEETRKLPRVGALFAQTYRTFGELFGGDARFWDRLEAYFIDYIDAMDAEVRFTTGETRWEDCSETECLSIERRKNGLVRLVDAGVAALSGSTGADTGAGEILLDVFVANQMVDDLRDWREDVRDGALSLLLLRAAVSNPAPEAAAEIGRRIYVDGHAAHVLAIADEHMRRAIGAARALDATALLESSQTYHEKVLALRSRVEREVAALSVR